MVETYLIRVEGRFGTIACGHCTSELYGYDEEECPSCGAFINMDDVQDMSSNEFYEACDNA